MLVVVISRFWSLGIMVRKQQGIEFGISDSTFLLVEQKESNA
jgi:hypothetical protein